MRLQRLFPIPGALAATLCSLVPSALATTQETFTLIQDTQLPIASPPSGLASSLAYLPDLDQFYVYDGVNTIRVLDHAGGHIGNIATPWSDRYFSQSGMTTDPMTGDILMLEDLGPEGWGPGARAWAFDPDTSAWTFAVDLNPLTTHEPIGLAINPANDNLIVAEVFGYYAGNGRIFEVTRSGAFVRTLVSSAQLLDLGVYFYADCGIEIFPPTGELVFGRNILHAVDLTTLAIRPFFQVPHEVTGMAFSPSGDEMALISRRRLYLYSANSAPTLDCSPSGDLECIAPLATVTLTADVGDADADELTVSWSVNGTPEQVTTLQGDVMPTEVSFTHAYGTLGAYAVEVTVSDGAESVSCTIDVTIVDETNPTAMCSMNVSQGTDPGVCYATLASLPPPVVSDNCGVASLTSDAPVDLVFPIGETTVTWTVTDVAQHTGTCTQTVTVEDNEPPVVVCGPVIELDTDFGSNVATWTLEAPTVSDNCGVPVLTSNYPDDTFPIGSTPVIWTATDDAGNEATCIQPVEVNARPTADCLVEQLTNIGDHALVSLNGTGSSDLEDDAQVTPVALTYAWSIDDGVNPALIRYGVEVSEILGYGDYSVTLTVTDSKGATGTTTCDLSVDPAVLAVFQCEKVDVKFCLGDADSDGDDDSSRDDDSSNCASDRISIKGEIGLPMGVDHAELEAVALVMLDVAEIDFLGIGSAPITFDVHGSGDKHWKYRDSAGTLGITKLEIDWEGARFKYDEHSSPVEFRSELITSSETVITMEYKMSDIGGAFTVDIAGALIEVDANGVVTSNDVPAESRRVKRHGKKVTLTLPFPLIETSTITFGGALSGSAPVLVADHYTNSLGRFKLEAESGTALPDGADTTPRTLNLMIGVGGPLYPGWCDEEWTVGGKHSRKWRAKH